MNSPMSERADYGRVIRYLLVGSFNTLFGYGCFAGLNYLFGIRFANAYIVAYVLANCISITVAFLGYKWFVFRTKGNYLREWLRCFAVYGFTMVLSTVTLPIFVSMLGPVLKNADLAPYVAAGLITCCNVVLSFFGHKHVSFRQTRSGAA